jgi:hypothetical protein
MLNKEVIRHPWPMPHKAPTTGNRKQLRRIVGMINYYGYMWKRRSHLLAPLAALLSTKQNFVWTPEWQVAFDELKMQSLAK